MKILIKILAVVLMLAILIFIGSCLRIVYYANKNLPLKSPIDFLVPKGMTVMELAYQLKRQGVLDHPKLLIQYVRFRGQLTRIQAGNYHIAPPITPRQLINKLVNGDVILVRFTIIEGWTYQQMIDSLKQNPGVLHTLADTSPPEVMQMLGTKASSPEGLFYPDTYFFSWGTSDKTVLQLAYRRMQNELNTIWQMRDSNLPYKTPYQMLIAASLIEKETALKSERPQIAGVIINRLKIHMPLQIDASVIYGLGSAYKDSLTRQDLKTYTVYNTYMNYGLPPTPIGFPSKTSMEAAAHPVINDNLYYVAKGDGSHIFTRALKQHIAAIKEYLLPLKQQKIDLPKQENLMCKVFNLTLPNPYQAEMCTNNQEKMLNGK